MEREAGCSWRRNKRLWSISNPETPHRQAKTVRRSVLEDNDPRNAFPAAASHCKGGVRAAIVDDQQFVGDSPGAEGTGGRNQGGLQATFLVSRGDDDGKLHSSFGKS